MRWLFEKRGQNTLEYAILIAVVVAGLIGMQGYVRRGMQGRLRTSADELGEQFSPGSLDGSLTTRFGGTTTINKTADGTTTTTHADQYQLTDGTVRMTTNLADDDDM